jgi:hypothetical protein
MSVQEVFEFLKGGWKASEATEQAALPEVSLEHGGARNSFYTAPG